MSDVKATPGTQAELRRANQQRVIEILRTGGTLTQAEIARATGLSAASVSNIVRDLSDSGTVSVRQTSSNGRRARGVTLVRPPGAVIGIAFDPDRISVALGDGRGTVVARESIGYDVAAGPERGVRRAVWLTETLLGRARADRSMVTAAGVSLPAPVDTATGEILGVSCLPRWDGSCPSDALAERLGMPVFAENDANLCALEETRAGVGRGREHVIYLCLSHGVGAGMIVSGQLLRGAGGTAGEIGHMGLDERGQVCRCGNRGCLETVAGAPYLLDMLPRHGDSDGPATLAELVDAAVSDPGPRRIIAEAGSALGRATAILANVVNPDLVIVGGELAAAGELLLEPMRRSMELGTLGTALNDLTIVQAELGAEAALRGALRLASAATA
ncbi:putative NBD/HSP70 family sugar kinase/putative transcriptional regulator [Lipingzhangella halophila]|uniref:Putative NBD/HSP70 family sugar kinase/putative transcriptional regulator n=1 Tax=Lipingzhangella halophila TaxID=1783352 RepID=A0A7W7RHV0_9ACTN|nr:ROK family transcriptional regulator [Lipingzhangella halophila]MBB4932180.1 putative NBD/HSP70 family sugar kinase/putative transcriptional regulator [Lipingzhangella halophila]